MPQHRPRGQEMAENHSKTARLAGIDRLATAIATGTLAAAGAFTRTSRHREQALRKELCECHDLLQPSSTPSPPAGAHQGRLHCW